MKADELDYREKIGQLFIIGMEGTEITDMTRKMIQQYKVGGIILYRRNYSNYEQMLKIIKDLKELNKNNKVPLFIAIDQEGGRVNRMPKDFKNLKSPRKITKKKDIELVKESIDITSEMLIKSGISMNFAPVLDIQRFKDDHPIGDRCYGRNKKDVCNYGVEAMKEMQKNGVVSVIKHFPGHGATRTDSHYGLPKIVRKIEKMETEDIEPFKEAIDAGADCIMVGHLVVKDVDKWFPVSLSKKIISSILREKLKYDGVVITDDIKMQAISLFYGHKFATFRALDVGNDMVMMRFSFKKDARIIDKVIKRKMDESFINQKVERILKLKEKYSLTDEPVVGCDVEQINNRIEEVNKIVESE